MATSGSRILAVVAVTALLSGAACGSGSSKPAAAADKAKAEQIVLTSADLPGFTAEADDTSDSSANPLDACLKNNPLLTNDEKPRGANGTDFSKDDGNVRVSSGAVLGQTETEARQAFSDLKGALLGQCVKDGLKASIGDGAGAGLTVGEVTAESLTTAKVADEVVASRLTVPLEAGGQQLSVFVDLTILRQGRVFAGVFDTSSGSPFPDAERSRLVSLVGQRMAGKAKNTPDTGPKPTTSTTSGRTATTGTTSTTGGAAAGLTPFSDPSGVSLKYPSGWSVEASSAGSPLIVFLDPSSETFRRNVNVLRQSQAEPFTLDAYTQLSLKQINDIPGATTGESRPTTLSGSPAYRLAYRADLGSGDLRFLAVWTVRSGKAWLVTYTADPDRFDAGLPDVERLLTTIELPT